MVGEALASGIELECVLAAPDFLAGHEGRRLAADLARPPLEVTPALLRELSDADAPQGILAVARLPPTRLTDLPRRRDGLYLFADGVQDPGNLGALARVAEAAGAVALLLATGSVHPEHPRAQRAAAGSLLRLPVVGGVEPSALDRHLDGVSPRWLALVPRGGTPLWQLPGDLVGDGALILALGAEGPGLSAAVRDHATLPVTIPLAPPVESLNVAVTAGLVLFELRRRRA